MKLFLILSLISTTALGQGLLAPRLELRNGVRADTQPVSTRPHLTLGLEASTNSDKFSQAQRLCSAILPYLDSTAFTPEQVLQIVRTRHSDILISSYKDIEIRSWITTHRLGASAGSSSRTITPESECLTRADNWLPRDVEDAIMASASEPDLTVQPVRQQTACDGISDAELEEFCKTETAILQDSTSLENIQGALQSTYSLPEQTARCNCLRDRVRRAFPDEQEQAVQIRNAKKNLDDLIVQHAGRKFLDRFASNEEDLNFMSLLPSGDERFGGASCINPQQFSSVLDTNCNVSQEDKQRRLNMIFNSYGRFSDAHTVEGLLQDFSLQLNNVNVPGIEQPVTRDQFDVRRISLANTDPKVRMIEGMISSMLSDRATRERIVTFMRGARGFPPKDAILHIFRLDYQNNNSLPSYLNINGLPDEAKAEMNRLVSGGDWSALSSHLVSQMRYASTLHPGLERMTENRAVFEEIVSTYSNEESSDRLFDRISRSNEIKNQFESDCAQQRNHLKEMVCTPPDELLRRVPGRDLQDIVSYNSPSTQVLELNSAILCDNPRSSPLDSLTNIFNQAYNPNFHSDFREHVNPNGMQTPFKRLMLAEQEVKEIQNEVGEAVITFEENNRGWADDVGGNRFYGDRGGRISDELIAETRRGNFSAELVERVQNSQIANSQVRRMNQTQVSQETTQDERENTTNNFEQTTASSLAQTNFTNVPAAGNYVSSGTAVTSGRDTSDLPDLRRNPFEFDESEINEMRSNLSSEQLAELEELKQQAQRDRDRLLALTDETQQARIRGLQEQLRQLENKRNQRVSDDSSDVNRRERIVGNKNLPQFQNQAQQFERVSIPNTGNSSPAGGSSSSPAAVSSGGSGSSASRLPASVPPVRNNQTQPGAFIITSEATRNGEVASEDLSLEIIRYISQNNPDLEVLTRIKENGMLYKFKTVENGVEKQKEIFIQFDRLTPDARRIVETQIESRRAQSPDLARLEEEITATRRSYSYEALKLIVGQEILRERR